MIHSVMSAQNNYDEIFSSWIKSHDDDFKLKSISIIEKNLKAIHDLESSFELNLQIFKHSVESIDITEQPKPDPRQINHQPDDAMKKSLSDRILRLTIVSASSRIEDSLNFAVEISVLFLQETLNAVKRE